uniref:Uncharacterized protein n=1 Tax=Hucho hucho TaxID=62062 RepID=A0A4W5KRJ9_9TELE
MALVGVRASYHRILNQIELLLPGKLRPIYNHPAGKDLINITASGPTNLAVSVSLSSWCLLIHVSSWCLLIHVKKSPHLQNTLSQYLENEMR